MKRQIYKSHRERKYHYFDAPDNFVRIVSFYRNDVIFRAVEKIKNNFWRRFRKLPEKWQDFQRPDGSFAEVQELETTFNDIYKEYIRVEISSD